MQVAIFHVDTKYTLSAYKIHVHSYIRSSLYNSCDNEILIIYHSKECTSKVVTMIEAVSDPCSCLHPTDTTTLPLEGTIESASLESHKNSFQSVLPSVYSPGVLLPLIRVI